MLDHCLQASACQGSLCSPLARTQACALQLSLPSIAASAGGYLSQRGPHWPTVAVWSLIILNDSCFPPCFTVFEWRFWICKRPGQIYGLVTQKGRCLMYLEAMLQLASHNNRHTTRPYRQTAIPAFTTPEWWWHMGFMDPVNNRRKWVRFVILEMKWTEC